MKGLITALVTSFNADGMVNESGLRKAVRHNIDEMKVDGLYVGGSTGEAFVMSVEERIKALEIVKDEAKDAVTLIAQIGSLNFDEIIKMGEISKTLKYDAVSAITPFYYKFSFEEIYAYYKKIDDALNFDMVIYSNPAMAGANFDIEKYRQLLSIPKVVGIKFSDADIAKFERLRNAFPEALLYFGYDEISIVGWTLGCDGAIGSTYNVMGDKSRKVIELLHEGKVNEARLLQHRIASIIEKIVQNGLYQTIKVIMGDNNQSSAPMKFPFSELTENQVKTAMDIKKEIEQLKV